MKKLIIFCFLHVMLAASGNLFGQDTIREIKILKGQTYLNFPVAESNRLTRAKIISEGKVLDQFTIKLANEKPDYWAFFDVTPFQGKTLTVEISNFVMPGRFAANNTQGNVSNVVSRVATLPTKGLQMVFADTKFPGQDSVYKEQGRLQAHFSARRGWLNDPNGLVYHNGEYHLYFQHNPYGWSWGNMHWGHAVIKDLLHWKELPEALYPAGDRDAAFSGSAVVDPNNTGGFRKNGIDPIIAFYTSTGRGECMKLSYDNGRTFSEYEGNPLIKHSGRDPKVFWYEPGNHWVLVTWDQERKKQLSLDQEGIIYQHLIYTSPNLKNWTFQSGVPGFFECPELFELPVEGQAGASKWVMYDATGRYVLGDFDGKKLSVTQPLKQYDYGGGYFYASQTYNNTPDKRRVQVGWGRGVTQPGMPFNQPMLFPAELKLKNTFDGLRVCPTPVKEISLLHQNSHTIENKILKPDSAVSVTVNNGPVHVIAEFEKGDAVPFGINVLGAEISFNDLLGEFLIKADTTPAPIKTNYARGGTERFKIEAIADKNLLEVYVNDGELYYTVPFNIKKNHSVQAFVQGRGDRKSILKKLEVHALKPIWENGK
jgi:fructan beta-fructosidase